MFSAVVKPYHCLKRSGIRDYGFRDPQRGQCQKLAKDGPALNGADIAHNMKQKAGQHKAITIPPKSCTSCKSWKP